MENQQSEMVINVSNMPTLQELERQYLSMVLNKTLGSKSEAAKILGVSVKTVYNKLDAYAAAAKDVGTTEEPS